MLALGLSKPNSDFKYLLAFSKEGSNFCAILIYVQASKWNFNFLFPQKRRNDSCPHIKIGVIGKSTTVNHDGISPGNFKQCGTAIADVDDRDVGLEGGATSQVFLGRGVEL